MELLNIIWTKFRLKVVTIFLVLDTLGLHFRGIAMHSSQ
jgi:hypothetical protein